ncbi:MAG: hypothetical protein NW217_02315 [Hyphomicrobiaceae bacterium]|nr:hypothetical protein [Hyphomicrobiaceae bacterium]
MRRMFETDDAALCSMFDGQLRKLQRRKLVLQEKPDVEGAVGAWFDETCRPALQFLSNPFELRASEGPDDRSLF